MKLRLITLITIATALAYFAIQSETDSVAEIERRAAKPRAGWHEKERGESLEHLLSREGQLHNLGPN